MFLGRLLGGRFALRVPPVRLLLVALGVSFAGFALFWTSTAGWLAVAGLFVAGLGNSVHYPLAISMALGAASGQEDRAAGSCRTPSRSVSASHRSRWAGSPTRSARTARS